MIKIQDFLIVGFRKILSFFQKLKAKFNTLSLVKRLTVSLLVLSFIFFIGYSVISQKNNPLQILAENGRQVSVASVLELSSRRTALPLVGTVTSISEATIRSESSGEIKRIYKKLGDAVSPGMIIAEIENSRERAFLSQAEAGLLSAQAANSISSISGERERTLLEEAKTSARNTLRSSYENIEDSIRTKIDPLFSDPTSSNPQFLILISDSQLLINLNFKRLVLSDVIKKETARKNAPNSLNKEYTLDQELKNAEKELSQVRSLIDDVIAGLNKSTPNASFTQPVIDASKIQAAAARSAITASISSLSNAKDNLIAKQAQYDISQKQSGLSGNTTSGAALSQAEAGIRLAKVNLEKTIIRSPISGTINNLSIELGDFVTSFEEVAVVSNNNALEIRVYITENDAKEIVVGGTATIDGTFEGVVTKIAPALDPKTKKIEVRIGIVSKDTRLVNGQSIRVDVTRTPTIISRRTDGITIPISAVKITADGPVVFSVEEGVLKSHPVEEGVLLGETISIKNGITSDMRIVTDARGLKAGESVTVK